MRLVLSHSSSSNRLVFTLIKREKAVTSVTLDSERHYKVALDLPDSLALLHARKARRDECRVRKRRVRASCEGW